MSTHIDTLGEWWSEAEHAPFREGDALIARFDDRPMPFEVYPADCDSDIPAENVRILARAPKPKPAWHDAPAVTATYRDDYGTVTGVWTPSGNHGYWIGPEDDVVMHDSLEDVTPLIEAKVTDEMVDRILDVIAARFDNYPAGIGEALAVAALGLEEA